VEERTRSAHRAIESGSPPASPCWGHCSRTTWRTRYWPGWRRARTVPKRPADRHGGAVRGDPERDRPADY